MYSRLVKELIDEVETYEEAKAKVKDIIHKLDKDEFNELLKWHQEWFANIVQDYGPETFISYMRLSDAIEDLDIYEKAFHTELLIYDRLYHECEQNNLDFNSSVEAYKNGVPFNDIIA